MPSIKKDNFYNIILVEKNKEKEYQKRNKQKGLTKEEFKKAMLNRKKG